VGNLFCNIKQHRLFNLQMTEQEQASKSAPTGTFQEKKIEPLGGNRYRVTIESQQYGTVTTNVIATVKERLPESQIPSGSGGQ
jgi:hypothetical protein